MTADEPSSDRGSPPPPPFHAELREVYAELDAEVARLAPVCLISGRCCRFREYGHTLFVSATEVQYLLSEAPEPARPLDEGETCPWQDDRGRCTARAARPLGCRVYFCDPAYQDAAPLLSERFIARLKRLAERHGLPWNYAPLHRHLHDRADPVDPAGPSGCADRS
jgi:Fe-S-cluster containining protein